MNDLEQIEALHRADEQAAMAQDHATLATLWSRDGVMLAPGGPRVRGPELFAQLEAATRREATHDVTKYAFDFEEVEVVGDYAFEWGIVRGTMRDRATGVSESTAYKLFRILRREDGEWKVHRAIWNDL